MPNAGGTTTNGSRWNWWWSSPKTIDDYYWYHGYIAPGWRYLGLLLTLALLITTVVFSSLLYDREKHNEDAAEALKGQVELSCVKVIDRFFVGLDGDEYNTGVSAFTGDTFRLPATYENARTSYPINVEEVAQIWVPDSVNRVIYIYDALSNKRIDTITGLITCDAPYKSFYSPNVIRDENGNNYGRVIVSCGTSDNFIILSPQERSFLQSVTIPLSYQPDYYVDDVLIGPDHIAVSLFHIPDTSGIVLTYNITYSPTGDVITFNKELSLGSNTLLSLWRNNKVETAYFYVASESGSIVYRFDWDNDFTQQGVVNSIVGAAGIISSTNERYLYVTDGTSATGIGALYKFEIFDDQFTTPIQSNTALAFPNQIAISPAGNRMLITHPALDSSTLFSIDTSDGTPDIATSITVPTGPVSIGCTSYRLPCFCDICEK